MTETERDYEDRDESHVGPMQRGEFAAALGAATVAFVVGIWFGLWLVPDSALAVPSTVENGQPIANYKPVPTHLPILSALVLGVGVWKSYSVIRATEETTEAADAVATDGGETDG